MTLPPELSKWSGLPFIQRRGTNEWSAACPKCGSSGHDSRSGKPDRLRLWGGERARIWCRRCGHFEWADGGEVTKADVEKWARRRMREEEKHEKEVKNRIERARQEGYWKGYHDALTAHTRKLWEEAGIPESAQDWWELGYNPEYQGRDFVSPALTIPFFRQSQFVTMQSRLLSPPDPSDKYRFLPGIPATIYFPDKDNLPNSSTLLVEGAKKAMVIWLHLGHKFNVAGLPSKHFSKGFEALLSEADPLYIMLDPDANRDGLSEDAATKLGKERCRIVTLPVKPDDFIVQYGASGEDLMNFINLARRPA